MYPHYHDGDKVLILKQDCINESGDIAAVIYDGEYATLKKVEYKKDAVRLLPLNPDFTSWLLKNVTGGGSVQLAYEPQARAAFVKRLHEFKAPGMHLAY